MVRINDPGGEWHELDLNQLLATARRELAFRERCYPRFIQKGTLTEAKAAKELQGMRDVVDFIAHCLFKAVTRLPKAS